MLVAAGFGELVDGELLGGGAVDVVGQGLEGWCILLLLLRLWWWRLSGWRGDYGGFRCWGGGGGGGGSGKGS